MYQRNNQYPYRVLISISTLLNVIRGGELHQSISAAEYEKFRAGKPNLVWLIDKLFFWEYNHCLTCWAYWVTKKHKTKINIEELNKRHASTKNNF